MCATEVGAWELWLMNPFFLGMGGLEPALCYPEKVLPSILGVAPLGLLLDTPPDNYRPAELCSTGDIIPLLRPAYTGLTSYIKGVGLYLGIDLLKGLGSL